MTVLRKLSAAGYDYIDGYEDGDAFIVLAKGKYSYKYFVLLFLHKNASKSMQFTRVYTSVDFAEARFIYELKKGGTK